MIATAVKPSVRVRKYGDDWHVQSEVELHGHRVWMLVASYSTWDIAFAVAEVEASPDAWPLRMSDRGV